MFFEARRMDVGADQVDAVREVGLVGVDVVANCESCQCSALTRASYQRREAGRLSIKLTGFGLGLEFIARLVELFA